ncbi:hypothetical protein [Kerstersia sp.]|uniref:hypothetical protein n=1 Tax=Kerstersia sp. TaxID=1930783 RepID=UPI003F8F17E2
MISRTLGASLLAVGLASLPGLAQSQSVYAKAGLLGAGLGYAHGLSPSLTLRADLTTIGSYKRNGHSSDFDYRAKLTSNQASGYLDWFPFDSGFRLTAGLVVRDLKATADARPTDGGTVTIGDTTVAYGTDDHADARVRFPDVAPYIGLGWGHNIGQRSKPGWGFAADVGVAIGKPKVDFNVNPHLYQALNAASGGMADQEIEKQRSDFQDDANKLRFFPQLYLGVAYYF